MDDLLKRNDDVEQTSEEVGTQEEHQDDLGAHPVVEKEEVPCLTVEKHMLPSPQIIEYVPGSEVEEEEPECFSPVQFAEKSLKNLKPADEVETVEELLQRPG